MLTKMNEVDFRNLALVHGAKLFEEASVSEPESRGSHPEVSHAHIGGN
jgi:hypothetical protein